MSDKYSINIGVRFYGTGFQRDKVGRSFFDYVFSEVYDEFRDFVILCDTIWVPDEDDEPELANQMKAQVILELDGQGIISFQHAVGFKGSVLPIYGPRMPGFEGGLVLFTKEKPKISSFREFESFDVDQFDLVHTQISNFDGAFWEIYSSDANVVERLIEKHRNDGMLDLYTVDRELDYKSYPIRDLIELKDCRIPRRV